MQSVATEFAEELDSVRSADDFRDDALPLLLKALHQGTNTFSLNDQRRVVTDTKGQK